MDGSALGASAPLLCAVLILLLGAVYALYDPPFQVPDEPVHFIRAYEVASGSCPDRPGAHLPATLPALLRRFPDHLNELEQVDDLRARYAVSQREPRGARTVLAGDGGATAAYSCLTYLPAALGTGAALVLRLPMIDVLFAARLGNVIAYAGLALLVLRLLPSALRPLGLLLLAMPMSLSQAASASQDPIVNGISLLFTAYVAHLAWAPREGRLSAREIGFVVLLSAALGQCKLSFLLIPLVLLIPRGRLPERRFASLAVSAAALLAAGGSFALWHFFGIGGWLTPEVSNLNAAANQRFLMHEPLFLGQRFFATLQAAWWFYLDTFIGKLGWLDVELPPPLIVAYAAVLAFAALATPAPRALTLARRALCLALGGVAVVVTFLVFWLIESPSVVAMQFASGQGFYEGVQGRYFIPFALPLAFAGLGLLRLPARRLGARAGGAALAAAAAVVCLGSSAAYAALHREFVVPQEEVGKIPYRLRHPARFYEGTFIHQIGDSPADDQILYVYRGKRYWIETARWFRKHGFTDVRAKPLPPAFVRRIPWGDEVWDADTVFDPTPNARRYANRFARDAAGAVWLIAHGVRHRILDPTYLLRDGYPLQALTPQEFGGIPVGDPIENFRRLDGSLVQATDSPDPMERGRVYYVESGSKRWVTDPAWLTRHGLRLDRVQTLPAATVDRIPEGPPLF